MSESTTILLRRIEDLFIIGLSEADDFSGNKMPMLPLYCTGTVWLCHLHIIVIVKMHWGISSGRVLHHPGTHEHRELLTRSRVHEVLITTFLHGA